MTKKLYEIARVRYGTVEIGANEHVVIRLRDERRVFYGTKQECEDWVERNGHDDTD
jgi:hypothetical protein